MKQRILLLVMLLVCQLPTYVVNAQESLKPIYRNFVTEGKHWNCVHKSIPNSGESYSFAYYFTGDTVINSQECKKMYMKIPQDSSPLYLGAFYQQGFKVYLYGAGNDNPLLMFDFGCETGDDTFYIGNEMTVIRVDTISGKNYDFRMFCLTETPLTMDSELVFVIEGLGGDLNNMFAPTGSLGASNPIQDCWQDDEELLNISEVMTDIFLQDIGQWHKDFLERQLVNIETTKSVQEFLPFVDLQGRRVTSSQPKPGIYMRQGRKFVVK